MRNVYLPSSNEHARLHGFHSDQDKSRAESCMTERGGLRDARNNGVSSDYSGQPEPRPYLRPNTEALMQSGT